MKQNKLTGSYEKETGVTVLCVNESVVSADSLTNIFGNKDFKIALGH